MADKQKKSFNLVQVKAYKVDKNTNVAKFVEAIDINTGELRTFAQEGFAKKTFVQTMADENEIAHAKIGSIVSMTDVTWQKDSFYTAKGFKIVSQDPELENAIVSPTKLYIKDINNSYAVILDDIDLESQVLNDISTLPKKAFETLKSAPTIDTNNGMRGVLVRLVGYETSNGDQKEIILPLEINSQGLSAQDFNARYNDKFKVMLDTFNHLKNTSDTSPIIEVIGTNILPIYQHPGTLKAVTKVKNKSFSSQGINQISKWGLAAIRLKKNPDTGRLTVGKVTSLSGSQLDIHSAGMLGNHLSGEKTIPYNINKKVEPKTTQKKTTPPTAKAGNSSGFPIRLVDNNTANGSLTQCTVITDVNFYTKNKERLDTLAQYEGGLLIPKGNEIHITFDIKSKSSVGSALSDLAGTPAIYTQNGIHQQKPSLYIHGRVTEQPFKSALDAVAEKYPSIKRSGYYVFEENDSPAILSQLAPVLNKSAHSEFTNQTPIKQAKPKTKFTKGDNSLFYRWLDQEFRGSHNLVLEAITNAGFLSDAASDIGVDWDATFANVSLSGPGDSQKLTGKDVKLLSGKRNTNIMVSLVASDLPRNNISATSLDLNPTTPSVLVTFTSRSTSLKPVRYSAVKSKEYGTLFDLYLQNKNNNIQVVPTNAELEAKRKEKAERIALEQESKRQQQENALTTTLNEFTQLQDNAHPDGYAAKKKITEVAHLIQLKHGQWSEDKKFDCYPLFNIDGQFISTQKLFQNKLIDEETGEETVNKLIAKDTAYEDPETGKKTGVHAVVGHQELEDETKPIVFVEGLADASSSYKATGWPSVVCVDIHNMQVLVRMFRERYPDRELLIVADNDLFRDKRFDNGNVGVQAAIDAAFNNNARYMIPDFSGLDLEQRPSDINDIELMAGIDTLSRQMNDSSRHIAPPKNIAAYHIERLKYQGFDSFDEEKEEAVNALVKAMPTRTEVEIRELINSQVTKPLPAKERIEEIFKAVQNANQFIANDNKAKEAGSDVQPSNPIQEQGQDKKTQQPVEMTKSEFPIEYKLIPMASNPSKQQFVFLDNGDNAERITQEIEKMDGAFRRHPKHENVYYVPQKFGYLLASRLNELTGAPKVYLSVVKTGDDKGNVIVKGDLEATSQIQKELNEIPNHYNIEEDGLVIPDPLIAKMTSEEKTLLVEGESTVQVTPFISILEFKFKDLFKPSNDNNEQIDKILAKKPLVGDDIQDQLNAVKEIFDVSEAQIQYGYFGLVKNGVISPKVEYISAAIFIKAFNELKQDYPANVAYDKAIERIVDDSGPWLSFLEYSLDIPNAQETINAFKSSVEEVKSKLVAINEVDASKAESTDNSPQETNNNVAVQDASIAQNKEKTFDDIYDDDIAFARQSDLIDLIKAAINDDVIEVEELEDTYLKAQGSPYLKGNLLNRELLNYDIKNLTKEKHTELPDGFKAQNISHAFNLLYTPIAQERFNVFSAWIDAYINEIGSTEKKTFNRHLNNQTKKDLGLQNPYVIGGELKKELMLEEIQMFSNSTTPRGFLTDTIKKLEAQGIELNSQAEKIYEHTNDGYTISHEVVISEQNTPLHAFIVKHQGKLDTPQFFIAHTQDSAEQALGGDAKAKDVSVMVNGLANKLSNSGALEKIAADERIIQANVEMNKLVLGSQTISFQRAQIESCVVGIITNNDTIKYVVGEDNITAAFKKELAEAESNLLSDGSFLSVTTQQTSNIEFDEVAISSNDGKVLRKGIALTSEGIEAIKASSNPIDAFDKQISILKPQALNSLESGEKLQKFILPKANIYNVVHTDGSDKYTTDYTRAKLLFGHLERSYEPKEAAPVHQKTFTASALDHSIKRASNDLSTTAKDIAQTLSVEPESLPLKEIDKVIEETKAVNSTLQNLAPSEKWGAFVSFISEHIESGMEYKDFHHEAFKPDGMLLESNPYFSESSNKVDDAAIRAELRSKGYKSLHELYNSYSKILLSNTKNDVYRPFIPESYDSSSLKTNDELLALKAILQEFNPVQPNNLIPFKNFSSTPAALMPIHPIFMEDITSLNDPSIKEKYSIEAYLLVSEVHGIKDVINTTSKDDIAQLITSQWAIRKELAGMAAKDIQELDAGDLNEYCKQLEIEASTNPKVNAQAISKHLNELKSHSVYKFAQYNFLKQVFANSDAGMRIPAYTHTDIGKLVTSDIDVVRGNIQHNVTRLAVDDLRKNRLTPFLKGVNIPSTLARETTLNLERGSPEVFGIKKSDHIKPGAFVYQLNKGTVDASLPLPKEVGYYHKLDDNTFSTPMEIDNEFLIKQGYSPISDRAVIEASMPIFEFAHRFGYVAFNTSTTNQDNNAIDKLVIASSNNGKNVSVTEITKDPDYKIKTTTKSSFEDIALEYAGAIKNFADLDLVYEQFNDYMPASLTKQTNDLRALSENIIHSGTNQEMFEAAKVNEALQSTLKENFKDFPVEDTKQVLQAQIELWLNESLTAYINDLELGQVKESNYILDSQSVEELKLLVSEIGSEEIQEKSLTEVTFDDYAEQIKTGVSLPTEIVAEAEVKALANIDEAELALVGGATSAIVNEAVTSNINSIIKGEQPNKSVQQHLSQSFDDLPPSPESKKDGDITNAQSETEPSTGNDLSHLVGSYAISHDTNIPLVILSAKDNENIVTRMAWEERLHLAQEVIERNENDDEKLKLVFPETNKPYVAMGLSEFMDTPEAKKRVRAQRIDLIGENANHSLSLLPLDEVKEIAAFHGDLSAAFSNDKEKIINNLLDNVNALYILMNYKAQVDSGSSPQALSLEDQKLISRVVGKDELEDQLAWMEQARTDLVNNIGMSNYVSKDEEAEEFGFIPDIHYGGGKEITTSLENLTIIPRHQFVQYINEKPVYELVETLESLMRAEDLIKPLKYNEPNEGQMAAISFVLYDQFGTVNIHDALKEQIKNTGASISMEFGSTRYTVNGIQYPSLSKALAENKEIIKPSFGIDTGDLIAFKSDNGYEYGTIKSLEENGKSVKIAIDGSEQTFTIKDITDFTLVSDKEIDDAKKFYTDGYDETIHNAITRFKEALDEDVKASNYIVLTELVSELESVVDEHKFTDDYQLKYSSGEFKLLEVISNKEIATKSEIDDVVEIYNVNVKANEIAKDKNIGDDNEPDPDNDPTPRSNSPESLSDVSAEATDRARTEPQSRTSSPRFSAEDSGSNRGTNFSTSSVNGDELHREPNVDSRATQRGIESSLDGVTTPSGELITRSPEYLLPNNYEADLLGTPLERLVNNITAIKVLKECQKEERKPNPEEKDLIRKYVGWGGLAFAFDKYNPSSYSQRRELRDLLTPDEYILAKNSTTTAFYTPEGVSRGVFDLLSDVEIKNNRLCDPCTGSGNFIGTLPKEMAEKLNVSAFDIDKLSADIASSLYGEELVKNKGFEDVSFPAGYFDLFVSNIPFGETRPHDRVHNKDRKLIHDYFISKSLDLTREGGYTALITSTGTLDKANSSARKKISEKAHLVGAIRLPNKTFEKIAGTNAAADILIFQKDSNAKNLPTPAWVETKRVTLEYTGNSVGVDVVNVNQYFIDNPQNVLGELKVRSNQYNKPELVINGDVNNLREKINDAGKNFNFNQQAQQNINEEIEEIEEVDTQTLTNQKVLANQLILNKEGELKKVLNVWDNESQSYIKASTDYVPQSKSDKAVPKELNILKSYVVIRDHVEKMLADQNLSSVSNDDINQDIKTLNDLYDKFTQEHGILNNQKNRKLISQDPTSPKVLALVLFNKETKAETKLDVFKKRVINPEIINNKINSIKDALIASISEYGHVDIQKAASLYGLSHDSFIDKAKGEMFREPTTDQWVISDLYLSGDVKTKLEDAIRINDNTGGFKDNIDALQKVIPADIPADDIYVQANSSWLPQDYVKRFAQYVISGDDSPKIRSWNDIERIGSAWGVNIPQYQINSNAARTENQFGTKRFDAGNVIDAVLNNKKVSIHDTIDGRRFVNKKETALAISKVSAVKELFQKWIWSDPDRANNLQRIYNDKLNRYVMPNYDASNISYHGLSSTYKGKNIEPRPHQKNALLRYLVDRNLLLAHGVGTGKTLTLATIALEGKYANVHSKPLMAVPNNVLSQIDNAVAQHYPDANILVLDPKTFNAQGRKELTAQIAYGDWDLVIVPHSMTQKLSVSPEFQAEVLETEKLELESALERMEGSRGFNGHQVKQQRNKVQKLEDTIKSLTDTGRKDDVLYIDKLGLDALLVDEADNFLNLLNATNMGHIKGVNNSASQRAMDMLSWVRHFQGNDKGGVVFATGTDIRNTMGDIYTNAKFIAPELLEASGIASHDEFMSVFGKVVSSIELNPEGTGFGIQERLAEFDNLPELLYMYRCFADVVVADSVDMERPDHNVIIVDTPTNDYHRSFMNDLSTLAKDARNGGNSNILAVMGMGVKGAVDLRLINPDAPDLKDNKINTLVNNVLKEYNAGHENKTTQLAFLDTGVNTQPFNCYDEIINKLVAGGMSRDEIIDSRQVKTDRQKKDFEEGMNSGRYRFALGSTEKFGVGNNVQERLVALHDVDPTWRTREMTQRLGRGLRQGNSNSVLNHYKYTQQDSFDYFMWQTLNRKHTFTEQIKQDPSKAGRNINEEVGADYKELMAMTSNNPKIKESIELRGNVESLEMKIDNARFQISSTNRNLKSYEEILERSSDKLKGVMAFQESFDKSKGIDIMGLGKMPLDDDFAPYKKKIIKGISAIIKNNNGVYPKVIEIGEAYGKRLILNRKPDDDKGYNLQITGDNNQRHTLSENSYKNSMFDSLTVIDGYLSTVANQLTSSIERYAEYIESDKEVLALPEYSQESLSNMDLKLTSMKADLTELEYDIQQELNEASENILPTLDELIEENKYHDRNADLKDNDNPDQAFN